MMRSVLILTGLLAGLAADMAGAELRPMPEDELQQVSGQAGISLSANLNFARRPSDSRCPGGCGARLAIKPAKGAGFLVLDNISGAFVFDGATLDIVGIDAGAGFAAESAAPGSRALRLGLANGTFNDFQWTLAGSNQAVAGGAGFKQTDLLTYQTNGQTRLQGNLYLFATP
jgi:hypothetical protein